MASFGGFFSKSKNEPTTEDKNEELVPVTIEGTFDPNAMHTILLSSKCVDSDAIIAALFLRAVEEVPKLVNELGTVLSSGNTALVDKINIVRGHLKETALELKVDENLVSLQDIIERDIRNKWTNTGKSARKATRNIVRLVWFLDFVVAFFTKMADETLTATREIVTQCWNETLGPRNRTLVNVGTKQLLKVAPFPEKQHLLEVLHLDKFGKQEMKDQLLLWAKDTNSIAELLWTYFKTNKIENVP